MEPSNSNFGKTFRNIILLIVVPLVILVGLWLILGRTSQKDKIQYSEIVGYFEKNQVEEYRLDLGTNSLELVLRPEHRTDRNNDGKIDAEDIVRYTVPYLGQFIKSVEDDIVNPANRDDNPANDVKYDYKAPAEVPWFINMLPTIVIIALIVVMWIMMRRSLSSMDGSGRGMGFGRAKVKQASDEKRKTTFADVAGADEEKEELREIVDFLKNPKKYKELGARIPKGVLLVGPPGTGKTLLARAVAGEAAVPFFSISGSDFVEMYVGVGASRVRDLFDQAKKSSPCIIFIDEIDAVGRHRGAGLGGGHDEREQTLNQLLVEMDGFGVNEGVIMIAATNRPDILDPALMRPGRFDRQIVVHYPDIKGREEILVVHSRGKPLAPDVNLKTIAKSTAGFTGADLENLLNEAALLSARHGLRSITMEQIEEATIKVLVGTEKRSRVVRDEEKRKTSYHEAGHAVVSFFSPTQDSVHQISIIPRGMAGGYTLSLPEHDKLYAYRKELLERIQVLLGGRIAEEIILDDISTGASNDIKKSTETAYQMVAKYGMSDLIGPILYASSSDEVFLGREMSNSKNFSEDVAKNIDIEVKRIITESYAKAKTILTDNLAKLHEVALFLFENEKMDATEFKTVMSSPAKSISSTDFHIRDNVLNSDDDASGDGAVDSPK